MIDKYLYPKWFEYLREAATPDNENPRDTCRETCNLLCTREFRDADGEPGILKLETPWGEKVEYNVYECICAPPNPRRMQPNEYIFTLTLGRKEDRLSSSYLMLTGNQQLGDYFTMVYNQIDRTIPIITGPEDVPESYKLIIDNPAWALQLSHLRLALAKSLKERLSGQSLLIDVPVEIIRRIAEEIEVVVGDGSLKGDNDKIRGGGYTFKGKRKSSSGKKKKRKSKKERRKTKRKSKRKKHKTKRRKY